MYSLLQALPLRQLLLQQAPVVIVSLVIAELFYKFQSFTLETIAFLATWFAVDGATKALRRLLTR